jgi:hypothetical protein
MQLQKESKNQGILVMKKNIINKINFKLNKQIVEKLLKY